MAAEPPCSCSFGLLISNLNKEAYNRVYAYLIQAMMEQSGIDTSDVRVPCSNCRNKSYVDASMQTKVTSETLHRQSLNRISGPAGTVIYKAPVDHGPSTSSATTMHVLRPRGKSNVAANTLCRSCHDGWITTLRNADWVTGKEKSCPMCMLRKVKNAQGAKHVEGAKNAVTVENEIVENDPSAENVKTSEGVEDVKTNGVEEVMNVFYVMNAEVEAKIKIEKE